MWSLCESGDYAEKSETTATAAAKIDPARSTNVCFQRDLPKGFLYLVYRYYYNSTHASKPIAAF